LGNNWLRQRKADAAAGMAQLLPLLLLLLLAAMLILPQNAACWHENFWAAVCECYVLYV